MSLMHLTNAILQSQHDFIYTIFLYLNVASVFCHFALHSEQSTLCWKDADCGMNRQS